ncbi:MAG TPA: DUF1648 domain-containing protein [Clostridia bacterium]|nr:DUF1648 domain-containing protein [Clostridia bacterium]
MNKNIKSLLILIIPLAICAVIYPFLPDQIPRQFHLDGTKSYMAREFIFLLGLVPYAIYLSRKAKR